VCKNCKESTWKTCAANLRVGSFGPGDDITGFYSGGNSLGHSNAAECNC